MYVCVCACVYMCVYVYVYVCVRVYVWIYDMVLRVLITLNAILNLKAHGAYELPDCGEHDYDASPWCGGDLPVGRS